MKKRKLELQFFAAGKVCTGFSKPYVAIYGANGGVVSYTRGQQLARGVNVNIAPNTSNDNKFYADNQEAESAAGKFTGGTLTLNVDGLFVSAERLIMGLPAAGADGFTEYGDDQEAPDMGFGYIARYMSAGVETFTPIVLAKVKFNQPSSEAATQEEEIDWQTQELTATIMRAENANHSWKYIGDDYNTEEGAEAALRTKLGITDPVTYTVTQNLSNVSSSFSGSSVNSGESLSATLTADTDYEISSVTVTMGGEDITSTAYSNGAVSIASVTGNVVIAATATSTGA